MPKIIGSEESESVSNILFFLISLIAQIFFFETISIQHLRIHCWLGMFLIEASLQS